MMPATPVPVTVIGGYLGAGKTTLLNTLLTEAGGVRFAVLVNDFGEINIDAELIESRGATTLALANGCICCTIGDNLGTALHALASADEPPDHILIEASGVADPAKVMRYAEGDPGLCKSGTIVVVDAETIRDRARDKFVGKLVVRQMQTANIILLSRMDLLDQAAGEEIRTWVRAQIDHDRLLEETGETVELLRILAKAPDSAAADAPPHPHFDTVAFKAEAPLDRDKFLEFLENLPETVWRAKGFVRFADDPASGYLVQRVGKRTELRREAGFDGRTRLVFIAPSGAADLVAIKTALQTIEMRSRECQAARN